VGVAIRTRLSKRYGDVQALAPRTHAVGRRESYQPNVAREPAAGAQLGVKLLIGHPTRATFRQREDPTQESGFTRLAAWM